MKFCVLSADSSFSPLRHRCSVHLPHTAGAAPLQSCVVHDLCGAGGGRFEGQFSGEL